MEDGTLTVSALNEYVRRSLAADPMLRGIRLRGEVSNFKQHVSGHWYFSLKDESARIACVMFRQSNLNVKFVPVDGVRVVLSGAVGLYAASGSYQFYAESMQKDGAGALFERFLALKEKLTAEGLFDAARKRPLPLMPRAVGIITSRTGAVLHDVVTVARRRCGAVPLVLRPAQVQGEAAGDDLVQALGEMAVCPGIDVIIIGRGGGSIEDLWAFNEERVVRAIAASPVPVISAVGHETDVTLSDFAADVRAATPSQAAEMAVPDRALLAEKIGRLQRALGQHAQYALAARQNTLHALWQRLEKNGPGHALGMLEKSLALSRVRLDMAAQRRLEQYRGALSGLKAALEALGPHATLRRGYALVTDGKTIVSSAKAVPKTMTIRFKDGQVRALRLDEEEGNAKQEGKL